VFRLDRTARAIGRIPALLLAYALQTISIVLPVLTSSPSLNLFSAILCGGTFVGIVSLTLALIGRYFPENPAKAMARLTLSYGVAQILAPAMAGYIATASGSYEGVLPHRCRRRHGSWNAPARCPRETRKTTRRLTALPRCAAKNILTSPSRWPDVGTATLYVFRDRGSASCGCLKIA
jgi:MFS family permease